MKESENKNVVELEIEKKDNKSNSNSKNNKKDNIDNENSFYKRQEEKEKTVWYKDWRGKALSITLATLILLGAGIPAGMAAAGYWSPYKGSQTNILDNGEEIEDWFLDAKNKLSIMENNALLDHYDLMVYEGLISQKKHDNTISDAEDSADETIKSEKDSLKKQYGNTWEEEWNRNLQSNGFDTGEEGEKEYKDSIVANSIKESIISIYTNYNNIREKVSINVVNENQNIYKSEENNGKEIVVINSYDYPVDDEDYLSRNNKYSYTPQDLITMYLLTYEPILFNNTLLPFLPVVGNSQTADIQGNQIFMTNDDILHAWSFARMFVTSEQDYSAAAQIYGGIQSKNSIDFSAESLGEEANIATMTFLSDKDLNSDSPDYDLTSANFDLYTSINTAFQDSIGLGVDQITSNIVMSMNDQEVTAFEESLETSLINIGLLNNVDSDQYRNWATINFVSPDVVSFVSTNGVNNIGIEEQGSELVIEQLNNDNGIIGSIDVDLYSSFNTWFENSFEYINLIDYFTDPVDPSIGWFTYDNGTANLNIEFNDNFISSENIDESENELSNTQLVDAFFADLAQKYFAGVSDAYQAGKEFTKTNWKQYDSANYSSQAGKSIIYYLSSTNMAIYSENYFVSIESSFSSNKVINIKRGDE